MNNMNSMLIGTKKSLFEFNCKTLDERKYTVWIVSTVETSEAKAHINDNNNILKSHILSVLTLPLRKINNEP